MTTKHRHANSRNDATCKSLQAKTGQFEVEMLPGQKSSCPQFEACLQSVTEKEAPLALNQFLSRWDDKYYRSTDPGELIEKTSETAPDSSLKYALAHCLN